jgi:hypothetical protein
MWSYALVVACGPAAPPPAPIGTSDATASAEVVSVGVGGTEGAYVFDVGVRSPDLDCTRYADWWEVVRPDGTLVYRRVLNHSHPDEQPFVRDGGPVPASATEELIVRAHLHPTGYGTAAFRGAVASGLAPVQLEAGFAAGLALSEPLPSECWS